MKLPLKPRLPLRGNEKLALAPFILVTEAGEGARQAAPERRPPGRVPPLPEEAGGQEDQARGHRDARRTSSCPTQNLSELARATGVLALPSASRPTPTSSSRARLEFRIEDRSGYKTEEYVSPINGQTYYRQVYVEQTGFLFDIVFLVFDGHTGEKLLQDEFKDFRQTGGRRADELQGLFENLFSLENQILNLFVAREREADRYLFTRTDNDPDQQMKKAWLALGPGAPSSLLRSARRRPLRPVRRAVRAEQDRLRQVRLEDLPLDALHDLLLRQARRPRCRRSPPTPRAPTTTSRGS